MKSTCRLMDAMNMTRDRARRRRERRWEGRAGHRQEAAVAATAEACDATGRTTAVEVAIRVALRRCQCLCLLCDDVRLGSGMRQKQVELTLQVLGRTGSPEGLPPRGVIRQRHGAYAILCVGGRRKRGRRRGRRR